MAFRLKMVTPSILALLVAHAIRPRIADNEYMPFICLRRIVMPKIAAAYRLSSFSIVFFDVDAQMRIIFYYVPLKMKEHGERHLKDKVQIVPNASPASRQRHLIISPFHATITGVITRL